MSNKYTHLYIQYQRTHIFKRNIDRSVGKVDNTLIVDFQLSTFKNAYNVQVKNY